MTLAFVYIVCALVALAHAQDQPKSCLDTLADYEACMDVELAKAGISFKIDDVNACFARSPLAQCLPPPTPNDDVSASASVEAQYYQCFMAEIQATMSACVDAKTAHIIKVKDNHAPRKNSTGSGNNNANANSNNSSTKPLPRPKGKGWGLLNRFATSNRKRRASNNTERPSLMAFLMERASQCGVESCAVGVVGASIAAQPQSYEAAVCRASKVCKLKRTSKLCDRERADMQRAACECGVEAEAAARICSERVGYAPIRLAIATQASRKAEKPNCTPIKQETAPDMLEAMCAL